VSLDLISEPYFYIFIGACA